VPHYSTTRRSRRGDDRSPSLFWVVGLISAPNRTSTACTNFTWPSIHPPRSVARYEASSLFVQSEDAWIQGRSGYEAMFVVDCPFLLFSTKTPPLTGPPPPPFGLELHPPHHVGQRTDTMII
jgi:hypothetical protein